MSPLWILSAGFILCVKVKNSYHIYYVYIEYTNKLWRTSKKLPDKVRYNLSDEKCRRFKQVFTTSVCAVLPTSLSLKKMPSGRVDKLPLTESSYMYSMELQSKCSELRVTMSKCSKHRITKSKSLDLNS